MGLVILIVRVIDFLLFAIVRIHSLFHFGGVLLPGVRETHATVHSLFHFGGVLFLGIKESHQCL